MVVVEQGDIFGLGVSLLSVGPADMVVGGAATPVATPAGGPFYPVFLSTGGRMVDRPVPARVITGENRGS